MKKKTNRTISVFLALMAIFLLVGCSKKEPAEEQPAASTAPAAAPATPIDPATAATVAGTVKFEGVAPKPAKIDMSQDPNCKGSNSAENIIVTDGKLANVFVYVKEGLGNRTFALSKDPVVLDQRGCRYHPHVLGVMVGQTLQIANSDPTTHNIHPTPKDNREWNESQAPQAPVLEKTFAREEIMLPVKCNQHPWMKMFVSVTKSPFYAVTGPDGKFELKGLPPGDYTLAFVHERLGEQDLKVSLGAKESKTLDASFKP
jgi:plastocyanin/predicted small lipoprotein YifL